MRTFRQLLEGEYVPAPAGDQIEIGTHTVVFNDVLSDLPYGGNKRADVTIDGERMVALRQGSIGIWAFGTRPKWNRADTRAFDLWMDETLEKRDA
jgi:hypothetical protein